MSARRRREAHAIYLIPGFFGFTNLGRLRYFTHVDRFLRERLRGARRRRPRPRGAARTRRPRCRRGRRSWSRRSRARARGAARSSTWSATRPAASTRAWWSTPGVALPTKLDVERWAGRVRSVVGVSAPQRGTPLAAYLTTRRGQRRLALLSLATSYVLRFGHLPLSALLGIAAVFARPRRGARARCSTISRSSFSRTSRWRGGAPSRGCCARCSRTSRCCSS